MIISTNSGNHLIILAAGITIYLMSSNWATGSTPGGARVSISWVGEACRIQIGHNDVFLKCFHERKGSITTQQKFEEKGLIVSTLVKDLL